MLFTSFLLFFVSDLWFVPDMIPTKDSQFSNKQACFRILEFMLSEQWVCEVII
jgi:hypothetical protein